MFYGNEERCKIWKGIDYFKTDIRKKIQEELTC